MKQLIIQKLRNLKLQLQDAEKAYNYHKARQEWDKASKWSEIHSHISRLIVANQSCRGKCVFLLIQQRSILIHLVLIARAS